MLDWLSLNQVFVSNRRANVLRCGARVVLGKVRFRRVVWFRCPWIRSGCSRDQRVEQVSSPGRRPVHLLEQHSPLWKSRSSVNTYDLTPVLVGGRQAQCLRTEAGTKTFTVSIYDTVRWAGATPDTCRTTWPACCSQWVFKQTLIPTMFDPRSPLAPPSCRTLQKQIDWWVKLQQFLLKIFSFS